METIDSALKSEAAAGVDIDEIILIGHSFGALLARKVYLFARGENESARFEDSMNQPLQPPRPWANKIRRIILLAGMNRGWSISHHMGISTLIKIWFGNTFANALHLFARRKLLISHVRRGAPFLTQLRLQWIAMERRGAKEKERLATIIQLLGSVDDIVSPEDNIDLITGRDFIYLDVPRSGHADIIQMDDSEVGNNRKKVFLCALSESAEQLKRHGTLPSDEKPPTADDQVTDVIFVIHGIRDKGFWTQKIARFVQRAGLPKVYSKETSSYGYFAMFPFLMPWKRREKVEWLMDQYVEAQALYPNAQFSFVGHSNGTYLLTKALDEYRSCRFKNVVLAGSVVPRKYDWLSARNRGQVEAVLNYVASADWVVACFPGGLERWGLPGLGSGGHNGFDQFVSDKIPNEFSFYQCRHAVGGHGAAIDEKYWESIAHFVIHGTPLKSELTTLAPRQSPLVVALGWLSPLLWLFLILIVLMGAYFIWKFGPEPEWMRTLLEVTYFWIFKKVLTKM